jgi:hypothetical protein
MLPLQFGVVYRVNWTEPPGVNYRFSNKGLTTQKAEGMIRDRVFGPIFAMDKAIELDKLSFPLNWIAGLLSRRVPKPYLFKENGDEPTAQEIARPGQLYIATREDSRKLTLADIDIAGPMSGFSSFPHTVTASGYPSSHQVPAIPNDPRPAVHRRDELIRKMKQTHALDITLNHPERFFQIF